MGFGLLLMGYFLIFIMSNFHAGFAFVGGYLMTLGVWKLKDYKSKFRYALYPLGAFMAIALKDTVLDILSMFGERVAFFEISTVSALLDYLEMVSICLINFVIFVSISELASDVKLEKIRVSALRNVYFFFGYTLLCAIRRLPLSYPAELLKYFNLAILLMQIFWIVVSTVTLLSCFRNIADKEKLDKEIAREIEEEQKKDVGGK